MKGYRTDSDYEESISTQEESEKDDSCIMVYDSSDDEYPCEIILVPTKPDSELKGKSNKLLSTSETLYLFRCQTPKSKLVKAKRPPARTPVC